MFERTVHPGNIMNDELRDMGISHRICMPVRRTRQSCEHDPELQAGDVSGRRFAIWSAVWKRAAILVQPAKLV